MNTHFTIPERVRIFNNSTKFPITFRNNLNAVVAAAGASRLSVEGMGIFNLPNIVNAKMSRGFNPTTQKFSITAATAGEITVVAPLSATRVWIDIELQSVGRDFATARNDYQFGTTIRKEVTAVPGETAGSLLAKLYNSLFLNTTIFYGKNDFLVKSGSGTAGTFVNAKATTLTELELEVADRNYFIKSFRVYNDENQASTVLTTFAPTQIVPFNRGINYGSDIEFREKPQFGNNTPYWASFDEIPVENQIYTMLEFTHRVVSDTQDPALNPNRANKIFLLQSACEPLIDSLSEFFDQLGAGAKSFDAVVAGTYTYGVTAAQFRTNA